MYPQGISFVTEDPSVTSNSSTLLYICVSLSRKYDQWYWALTFLTVTYICREDFYKSKVETIWVWSNKTAEGKTESG